MLVDVFMAYHRQQVTAVVERVIAEVMNEPNMF